MIISEYNPAAAERLTVSDKDRPQLCVLIDQICMLCRKAREDGLLTLDSELPGLSDQLLQLGVRLVLDGTDTETVKGILLTAIHAGNYNGAELVKRMIVSDGILLLQRGQNPSDVKIYLSAYLGEAAAASVLDG